MFESIKTFIYGYYSLHLHQILIYGYERLKSAKDSVS